MTENALETDPTRALTALASGIIPADEIDAGAEVVNAGVRLAEKMAAGVNAALYENGLHTAESLSQQHYARSVDRLNPTELHELVGLLRSEIPAFYKQLRLDVCAMYLSDPGVWQRIGFPGPSTESGGYPDFYQPQH